jgi:hypothetical protein
VWRSQGGEGAVVIDGNVVQLGEYETILGHPCAEISLFAPDLDVMAYLLQDLRTLLRSADAGKIEVWAHRPFTWEVHSLHRRTVICDPVRIRDQQRVCVVGFFGNRRTDLPFERMDDIDVRLLDEFRSYPGILSYSSMELADDYWANLVVHVEPDDRDVWRTNSAHRHAVEMSPRLYSSVRIYNGHLPGGVAGSRAVEIDSTKYWDYEDEPTWKAIRVFDPPLTRVRRQEPHLD